MRMEDEMAPTPREIGTIMNVVVEMVKRLSLVQSVAYRVYLYRKTG